MILFKCWSGTHNLVTTVFVSSMNENGEVELFSVFIHDLFVIV